MAIKVETSVEETQKEITFPILMKDTDSELIVLFNSEECGPVVQEDPDLVWKVGQYSKCWISAHDKQAWVPFEGSLTLYNE